MKMDTTPDMHNVLDLLQKSEHLGENVLRDRSEVVHLDRIRQKNREALNSLKRVKDDHENVYICVGNMFIKHRISRAKSLIEQDQKQVDEHLQQLRTRIKNNVEQIHQLEGNAERMRPFNLNPLSSQEMKGFNVVLDSINQLNLDNR